jgi:hypothetical protein
MGRGGHHFPVTKLCGVECPSGNEKGPAAEAAGPSRASWGCAPAAGSDQAAAGLVKLFTVALTRALIGAIASLVTFADSSCSLVVSDTMASKVCLT